MRAYSRAEKGFTMIELMMVIVVLALIMSLAIGAAIRSISAGRELRADAMRDALNSALSDYRAREGKWPCALPPDNSDDQGNPTSHFSTFDTVDGNKKVFGKLIEKKDKGYLDASAFLVVVNPTPDGANPRVARGKRMSLLAAMDANLNNDCAIGYPNPRDQTEFIVYKVKFNLTTDSVTVER